MYLAKMEKLSVKMMVLLLRRYGRNWRNWFSVGELKEIGRCWVGGMSRTCGINGLIWGAAIWEFVEPISRCVRTMLDQSLPTSKFLCSNIIWCELEEFSQYIFVAGLRVCIKKSGVIGR